MSVRFGSPAPGCSRKMKVWKPALSRRCHKAARQAQSANSSRSIAGLDAPKRLFSNSMGDRSVVTLLSHFHGINAEARTCT